MLSDRKADPPRQPSGKENKQLVYYDNDSCIEA